MKNCLDCFYIRQKLVIIDKYESQIHYSCINYEKGFCPTEYSVCNKFKRGL